MGEVTTSHLLEDEAATVALGAAIAREVERRYGGDACVWLSGPLGAGKTTLVRGVLQALGHRGAVKSPTYTLLEPYAVNGQDAYHFDLYRVVDPEELALIGFDEILDGAGLKLLEWPERAHGWLPPPDVAIELQLESRQHVVMRRALVTYVD